MSVYIVAGKRPKPQPTGERRVSRGGAWRHAIKVSRCSARSSIPPDYRYNDHGFRVVLNGRSSSELITAWWLGVKGSFCRTLSESTK